ncbi:MULTISPECIES: T9SS type A sorting domain-containing protein [Flavobacterium]|uniref:T9SS type A sorting domain-containing protein n=1 Tax=Flavobacterium TaxID=237 RepID=UPI001182751E|nr:MULTISPECIES: T9SS type A sorting domain-containing protein [Flavobacterium]MCR4032296.1 T9SS type A sorting domain-containing protein [Flavobacterium panacis]
MKNNKLSTMITIKRDLVLMSIFFMLVSIFGNAQTIVGNNPYCIASGPNYTIINPPAPGTYDSVEWLSNDPGITFSGNPDPLTLSKVVIKSGNIINAPSNISAKFYLGGTQVAETGIFNFITAPAPSLPSYVVTKTSDYCTPQYHIITLNVAPTPNPSPNANFYISPRVADASIIITQTSKNVFELKLPLNGQPYFLYDVTCTVSEAGCLSNSVSVTSYSNSVSLNLTNCANNSTPATNYDFTVAPNPYSNGYLTIVSPIVTSFGSQTICRIYNTSGTLNTTFPLSTTSTSTSYALRSSVGASLVPGVYIVQVMYPNGTVRSKNLIVN